MRGLSVILLLLVIISGCSWHVDRYGDHFRNVDIRMGGQWDHPKAENDAQKFEDQINAQFDSNITLPRLPFIVGRYVDSITDRDGIRFIKINGEF